MSAMSEKLKKIAIEICKSLEGFYRLGVVLVRIKKSL